MNIRIVDVARSLLAPADATPRDPETPRLVFNLVSVEEATREISQLAKAWQSNTAYRFEVYDDRLVVQAPDSDGGWKLLCDYRIEVTP